MTVRWKPLLILSGLFVAVAVVGVVAISTTLAPPTAQSVLKQARAAREAGRPADAEIHYKQALQADSRNAAVHEEFAGLYDEMIASAPADRREALRAERTDHLIKAKNFDKNLKGPRLRLLLDAMADDVAQDAVYWAREVATIDPENADAAFVLAMKELESGKPNLAEVRKASDRLAAGGAVEVRKLLIRARLADETNDDAGRAAALAEARKFALADDAGSTDLMAKLRLSALDLEHEGEPAARAEIVKGMVAASDRVVASAEPGSQRVTRLSFLLEQTQRAVIKQSQSRGEAGSDESVDAIERQLASLFEKSRQAGDHVDFQIYLTYADHLRFRRERDRCLQVVGEALASPLAARPSSSLIVLGLHTVGAEMALVQADDPARLAKADPHIKALLSAAEPRYQGLGHLFQGAVELESSGVIASASGKVPDKEKVKAQPKLRASALAHLKAAAQQLPEVAEAQARYGVALVLNQEQALGRQYLQNALRMSALDAQYEFWAAWTMLQAGYPEEAVPIVDSLARQLAQGTVPGEMKVVLHQLSGELYQARRGPGDLDRAAQEFDKVAKMNGSGDSTSTLRLAQIDAQRGKVDEALARTVGLRDAGQLPAGGERLAVLLLEGQGKKEEARKALEDAKARFPKSIELTSLDASLKAENGKAEEAEKVLAAFLAENPDELTLVLMRAQILSDKLKRPDEARKILAEACETSTSSSPWVQLAQLEMGLDNLDAAAAVIAKVRSRWQEGATADILEGQLALKKKDIPAAIARFDEALKKDPENKIVAFWKAQLDGRSGAVDEAAKALEDIVRDKSTKEVEAGVTLMSAAQSALAGLSLQNGDVDDAIRRFEELKRNNEAGALARADRWQLVTAYVAKKQWPLAKAEIAAILADKKNKPTPDERVKAANFYRLNDEESAAIAVLDEVLKENPTKASAIVTRAFLEMRAKQYPEATKLLRGAVAKLEKGDQSFEALYLMLAAVENETPPLQTSPTRTLTVVDEGLGVVPDSISLVQAKYLLLAKGGDAAKALEFVESKVKDDPKGTYRRLLVDVYRHQKNYEGAEKVLRGLVAESPDDGNLAASLVEVVSLAAADAMAAGDADKLRSWDEKCAALITEYRPKFPTNLAIIQAECDQAARRGDMTRAVSLTQEIDKVAKNSAAGPLLRARLFASQRRAHDVASAYAEAVEREPRRLDVRVALGRASLDVGNVEEALQQAKYVLANEKTNREAVLLQARALDASGLSDAQREAARSSAVAQLEAAVAADPKFVLAYQAIAEIESRRNRRPAAAAALRRALAVDADEPTTIARYIQTLAEGGPADAAGLAQARLVADEVVGRDKKGGLVLAAAVGFHKARRLDMALPLSEKAATMLDTPVAHLNLGDLLLSLAEGQPDASASRAFYERAVAEYDRVLALEPGSVEAVNNKAWILHSSLGRSQEALTLVKELLPRVHPASLPGEFFDTMGAIQESVGRASDAEESYLEGLKRSPDLAVLNYHYGKLISADRARGERAKDHLSRAIAAKDQLAPDMTEEAVRLVKQLDGDAR